MSQPQEDTGPEFTIRATHPLAVRGLITYARALEERHYAAEADRAFNAAMDIAVWQREFPEKVKTTTDPKELKK